MKKKLSSIELPLPEREERVNLQVEIPKALADALKEEAKRTDVFTKDIIIWGIKMFLARSNAELAEKLRLLEDDAS